MAKRSVLLALSSCWLVLAGYSISAHAADFTLYNDIRDPVVSFKTQHPDGTWSSNWLSNPIGPGRHQGLVFGSSPANAACNRVYWISTESGREWRAKHDFCNYKGIHVAADGLHGTAE